MAEPIKHITIVGGGTAGWMSALILSTTLEKSATGKGVHIKLIESPNIPTVGVGEATVPGMPRTLQDAGISEEEFFKTCNASFKLGVLFDSWNVDARGDPVAYVNPFARPPVLRGRDAALYYAKYGGDGMDFTQVFSPSVDLYRAHRGPRPITETEQYKRGVGYAYHLDAGLFSKMLSKVCIERGVEHVQDDMERVELDDRGYVAGLHLKETGRHPVELVLDCTGFRGLIINEALGEEFVSYSDFLANDRAMAVQIPHPDPDKLDSVTRSTALGAGWTWHVPLFNRIGTGYVFSSAHRTDEQARSEFLEWLGPRGEGAEPRVIPMRVGRSQNAWVKNCVAIGLSGGFIEPLESTAIHMIDMGVRWLVTFFPDTDFAAPPRARYNKTVDKLYNEVRDFICAHYALGNRTDSDYWIDARESLKVPDSLAENLELWKHCMPGPYDLEFSSLFSHETYQTVLLGKKVYETGYGRDTFGSSQDLDPDLWQAYLGQFKKQSAKIVNICADHRSYLKNLRGEQGGADQQPWGAGATIAPTVGQVSTGFSSNLASVFEKKVAEAQSKDTEDANLL